MKIAYFGTPELSASLLSKLIARDIPIEIVITQPDKQVGKRLAMTPTAVKSAAVKQEIEMYDKELTSTSQSELIQILQSKKIELCLLFAYGRIISNELLASIPHGFWNVHPSLLPAYRGASPTVFPLLLGDPTTGCTLIEMNSELDEGEIICQDELAVDDVSSRVEVESQLIDIAVDQIQLALPLIEQNKLQTSSQPLQGVSYTRKITRSDGYVELNLLKKAHEGYDSSNFALPELVSWYREVNDLKTIRRTSPATMIHNMVRALSPWPGVWTEVLIQGNTRRLKILETGITDSRLIIQKVQLEGKSPVEFEPFQRAHIIF